MLFSSFRRSNRWFSSVWSHGSYLTFLKMKPSSSLVSVVFYLMNVQRTQQGDFHLWEMSWNQEHIEVDLFRLSFHIKMKEETGLYLCLDLSFFIVCFLYYTIKWFFLCFQPVASLIIMMIIHDLFDTTYYKHMLFKSILTKGKWHYTAHKKQKINSLLTMGTGLNLNPVLGTGLDLDLDLDLEPVLGAGLDLVLSTGLDLELVLGVGAWVKYRC